MNRRYTYKAWQVGDNVAWDECSNWKEYGKRKQGQILKIWKFNNMMWVLSNNGEEDSIYINQAMEPDFP